MLHMNLIDGQPRAGGEEIANINPSDTSDTLGLYAFAAAADAEAAVQAARAAQPGWWDAGPQARANVLDAVGSALIARKDEIGRMLSREEGKTLAEGIGETLRAGQIFKFFAGEAVRMSGDHLRSLRPGIDVDVGREPVGVVALITPWNFPISIPAWKTAPALAFGNAVILKPAELTPACAHLLGELITAAGAPPGIFNLLMGRGDLLGPALLDHPGVDAVSFTGSVATGRSVAQSAARSLKRLQLEMGGKNPCVVMDDADLDLAVEATANGAFVSTGQRCTASSRIIVQRGIYEQFTERLIARMQKYRVGNALAEETQIGPVVSDRQLQSNLSYVELAKKEGCEVIGGDRLSRDTDGFYQGPAVFLGATNRMRVSREEIFGPCAAILQVDDLDEAIAMANDTEFGLASSIMTSSLRSAQEFKRRSQVGMVNVNLPSAGVDYHVPFGGRKASSYGPREQGRTAVDFYTLWKTAYTFAG
ncbi:MAG: aldehyde dehydrogenase family protein [Proteobacteria bacterium]|nr:aldehyde dehydrogenase family protein [Pseudomonadota bacterium]